MHISNINADTFLPFDLECAFSAAFILTTIAHLYPKLILETQSMQDVKDVIRTIGFRGNMQAKLRILELESLEQLLAQQTPGLRYTQPHETSVPGVVATSNMTGQMMMPQYGNLFFDDNDFSNGFSSQQMMNLADALDIDDFDFLAR